MKDIILQRNRPVTPLAAENHATIRDVKSQKPIETSRLGKVDAIHTPKAAKVPDPAEAKF